MFVWKGRESGQNPWRKRTRKECGGERRDGKENKRKQVGTKAGFEIWECCRNVLAWNPTGYRDPVHLVYTNALDIHAHTHTQCIY